MRTNNDIILWFSFLFALGQVYGNAQSDSTILSYHQFLSNVLQHHPQAQQAALKIDLGEATLLAARGQFDPVFDSDLAQKNFDDKLYYRRFQGQLRLPTRLGVELIAGYENTGGVFLNPENATGTYGLWNAGIEVNLLQGLWINDRNTALRQARIFQSQSQNQQQILINQLLYQASLAYLEWQKYENFNRVIDENIALARAYVDNTRQSFLNGEKTAMDTLEAQLVLQDAMALSRFNLAALSEARQGMENFLWYEELPAELTAKTQSQRIENLVLSAPQTALPDLLNLHPLLAEKRNKQSIIKLEQRLKREKLKPKLKAKYNPLLATSDNGLSPGFSFSDYKWGFSFAMPLLFRSERADIQTSEIKLREITLDIRQKRNELNNKLENSQQQQVLLEAQIALQEQNVRGYRLLLEGENEKFRFGESSVFLLNKRQEKYLSGQLKLIDLKTKLKKEQVSFLYYGNYLFEEALR